MKRQKGQDDVVQASYRVLVPLPSLLWYNVFYAKKVQQRGDIMIINIAVCDDEQESLEMIQKELYKAAEKLKITIETYPYMDGKKVVDLLQNKKEEFDILFLDIDMPNVSGLEVAKKLREKGSEIILIFISAHEQYVFESIDYNPFKYIRKTKMQDEIEIALKRAYRRIISENIKSIVVNAEDGKIRLKHKNIMYFEMFSRKISVYTDGGKERKLLGRKTIKELYHELNDEDFIQIHSGCIVNTKYIDEYSGHDITLDNGKKLIVSRSRIKDVKEAMARYWREKV